MYNSGFGAYKQDLYKGAQETIYKDHKFRSRLEATWAMFFDIYGVEWQYESQVSKSNYLVDFYLPKTFLYGEQVQGLFIETKSAGAWGDRTERQNIINKAKTLIEEYNKPFIVIINQPGYCTGASIYRISSENKRLYHALIDYNLYKENNKSIFINDVDIKKSLKEKAYNEHNKNQSILKAKYNSLKANEVRNQVKIQYEKEQEKYQSILDTASEIDSFIHEYWKDNIKEYWTLDIWARIMGVTIWVPTYLKRGDNYTRNEIGYKEYLWDDNVWDFDEWTFSNKVMIVEKYLNKFFELKMTLPKKTEIILPNDIHLVKEIIDAIELEDYKLVFTRVRNSFR